MPLFHGTTSGTAEVTIAPEPVGGATSGMRGLYVHNMDTVNAIVIILFNNGSTQRQLFKGTVFVGETLMWPYFVPLLSPSHSVTMKLNASVTTTELDWVSHTTG